MKIDIKEELISELLYLKKCKYNEPETVINEIVNEFIEKGINFLDFIDFKKINQIEIKEEEIIEEDTNTRETSKEVGQQIDYYLWKRINDFIKERLSKKDFRIQSFSSFVNHSLIAYKNGMPLTFNLNRSRIKKTFASILKDEQLKTYNSFPVGKKREFIEKILGSYLEIIERKRGNFDNIKF